VIGVFIILDDSYMRVDNALMKYNMTNSKTEILVPFEDIVSIHLLLHLLAWF